MLLPGLRVGQSPFVGKCSFSFLPLLLYHGLNPLQPVTMQEPLTWARGSCHPLCPTLWAVPFELSPGRQEGQSRG